MPINYQNGKIYKIINDENELVYYGATTLSLSQRLVQHRLDYKYYLEGKKKNKSTSIQILKYKNPIIVLVEDCPCERKEQLTARERFWIENNPCVNKVIPGRTKKQYNEDNRELQKKKCKQYHKDNIEAHKDRCKQYYEENKNKIKENLIKKYEKTREKQLEKITCECGCQICRHSLTRHKKSQKHINLMKQQEKDAKTIGHSVSVQNKIYNKDIPKDNEDKKKG